MEAAIAGSCKKQTIKPDRPLCSMFSITVLYALHLSLKTLLFISVVNAWRSLCPPKRNLPSFQSLYMCYFATFFFPWLYICPRIFSRKKAIAPRFSNWLYWLFRFKAHQYTICFVRPLHSKPGIESYCWTSTDQLSWCYNQSGVTELLIMRDPHYGRMCFQSVKTLGALHF